MPTRKEASRPVDTVVKSIGEKASSVHTAAAALTECIKDFESYLSEMPGRVEANCSGPYPGESDPGRSLILLLERQGKKWSLSYAAWDDAYSDAENTSFKPVVEAPLKVKLASVKMFPDLLEAIEKSQDELVAEIQQIQGEYRAFAKTLPRKEGK